MINDREKVYETSIRISQGWHVCMYCELCACMGIKLTGKGFLCRPHLLAPTEMPTHIIHAKNTKILF